MQVEIEEPLEPDTEELAKDLLKERQKVANHAYGFISRGNREGGFAHVREWLEKESEFEEAWQWFFEEMLRWENKDPALFFAQEYLSRLLEWQKETDVLKLIVRCLHHNERWQPSDESKHAVKEIASRHERGDVLKRLAKDN